ncbi:MAG: glucose-6-phosphate isomerase [Deltaproteobacteria bacterium]|nr:glucose-6-phosphate isomerase [Deltaproteobacteria bacterium]
MNAQQLWSKFKEYYLFDAQRQFALDISRINFPPSFFSSMAGPLQAAFSAMQKLEAGEIANPDEKRMVGHYWLRDSKRAPSPEIAAEIDGTLAKIKEFAKSVHSGKIANAKGEKFSHLLVIGIGGSALGPQFVNQALGAARDPLKVSFFDNTDPDGMQKVLALLPDLTKTLVIVTSKSGGTKETRNGQLIAKHAFESVGLSVGTHFVAVTGAGSELDKTATAEKWLARFPMWDWIGGRTSEFSAVGLLPAALQGFDVDEILRGAREMDELTRVPEVQKNPAAQLALMFYHVGGGKGLKDMVVLPYKDRLELFSRYLQQLVMESLGKEKDLSGAKVNQGIAVYGNKGSTDQHAYVQQLREGLNNFFAVFIEVLRDDSGLTANGSFSAAAFEVEKGVTSGDYLSGFYQGTRSALFENQRESISITIGSVSPYSIGQLIALFERAVGLYASLVNINAYHQPGVEAGKKAAQQVLTLQQQIVDFLSSQSAPQSIEQIARGIKLTDSIETIFKIVRHLAANHRLAIKAGPSIFEDTYLRA